MALAVIAAIMSRLPRCFRIFLVSLGVLLVCRCVPECHVCQIKESLKLLYVAIAEGFAVTLVDGCSGAELVLERS